MWRDPILQESNRTAFVPVCSFLSNNGNFFPSKFMVLNQPGKVTVAGLVGTQVWGSKSLHEILDIVGVSKFLCCHFFICLLLLVFSMVCVYSDFFLFSLKAIFIAV